MWVIMCLGTGQWEPSDFWHTYRDWLGPHCGDPTPLLSETMRINSSVKLLLVRMQLAAKRLCLFLHILGWQVSGLRQCWSEKTPGGLVETWSLTRLRGTVDRLRYRARWTICESRWYLESNNVQWHRSSFLLQLLSLGFNCVIASQRKRFYVVEKDPIKHVTTV